MKTLTFKITDEEHARLVLLADVLNLTPEEFLFQDGVEMIIQGTDGNVCGTLAARIWDTLKEAQAAAIKADALDETAYMWYFFRQPDGRILIEADDLHIEKIEAAGNELVMQGQSADWKVAA